jgi:hypothetical protein
MSIAADNGHEKKAAVPVAHTLICVRCASRAIGFFCVHV